MVNNPVTFMYKQKKAFFIKKTDTLQLRCENCSKCFFTWLYLFDLISVFNVKNECSLYSMYCSKQCYIKYGFLLIWCLSGYANYIPLTEDVQISFLGLSYQQKRLKESTIPNFYIRYIVPLTFMKSIRALEW